MELRLNSDASAEFSRDVRRASPTSVLTVPRAAKVAVPLGAPASFYAAYSLLAFPPLEYSLRSGIGIMCAFICSCLVFLFCWSAVSAYFIRKYNLSPTWCRWAGMPLLLLGILIAASDFFGIGRHSGLGPVLICVGILTGNTCLKLAYPAISFKQMNNLEPRPPGVF